MSQFYQVSAKVQAQSKPEFGGYVVAESFGAAMCPLGFSVRHLYVSQQKLTDHSCLEPFALSFQSPASKGKFEFSRSLALFSATSYRYLTNSYKVY